MICVVQIHVFRLNKEKKCLTSKVDLTDVAICEPPVANVRWLVGFGFTALRNSIPVHKVRRLPKKNVGWMVVLGFNDLLRQYFSLYRAVSQRRRKKKEMMDESKNVQATRTHCKHSRPRPLPYY